MKYVQDCLCFADSNTTPFDERNNTIQNVAKVQSAIDGINQEIYQLLARRNDAIASIGYKLSSISRCGHFFNIPSAELEYEYRNHGFESDVVKRVVATTRSIFFDRECGILDRYDCINIDFNKPHFRYYNSKPTAFESFKDDFLSVSLLFFDETTQNTIEVVFPSPVMQPPAGFGYRFGELVVMQEAYWWGMVNISVKNQQAHIFKNNSLNCDELKEWLSKVVTMDGKTMDEFPDNDILETALMKANGINEPFYLFKNLDGYDW